MQRCPSLLLAIAFFGLTSCEKLRHQFLEPTPDWQAKVGQLQYRGARTSLIGEVLVRYSSKGDFELTFSKGPGVTLLTVRQDDKFVRVSGPLARGSWSVATPGNADKRLVLAQPHHDRVFFAGEATDPVWATRVGGAYASGVRAAREALAVLGGKR